MNFLTKKELKLSHEFKKKGYIIINIKKLNCLDYIQKKIIKSTELKLNRKKFNSQSFLNKIHKRVTVKELNNFRVNIMKNINNDKKFKQYFYEISKELLDPLLGNELVMQKRISLSIQFPKDKSSLLPIHSDTWSGLSPFEAVAWLPLVNCYKTKSMYILPPPENQKFISKFKNYVNSDSQNIFKIIKKKVVWLNLKYGQILIFNQQLPHGNVVNNEKETRWSLNCRFKGIFSPYADKRIGEFYEPITLRPMSELGFGYKLPKFK
tara:strand:- start:424 stop:1218 length:795 start_codon:yes stop_codon:yes gene_type:complete